MASALSELAAARAAEELGETPELLATAPGRLKLKLAEAAALPANEDIAGDLKKASAQGDAWQLRFLRVRKYDVDEATKNVCGWLRWHHVQVNLPQEMFDALSGGEEKKSDEQLNTDLFTMTCADYKDVLEESEFRMLPGYSKDGAKYLCLLDLNAFLDQMKALPVRKLMLGMQYMFEVASLDPDTQVCGIGIIEDLEGANLGTLRSLMKRKDMQELQKKKAKAMNDAFPFRFAAMWLLDPPWFYYLIWNIFKWLLKKKLRDRIHLISKGNAADMAKLRASFDPAQLPEKLGGTLTEGAWTSAHKQWIASRLQEEAMRT